MAKDKSDIPKQNELELATVDQACLPNHRVIESAEILTMIYDLSTPAQQLLALITSKICPFNHDLTHTAYKITKFEARRFMCDLEDETEMSNFAKKWEKAKDQLLTKKVELLVWDKKQGKRIRSSSAWISEVLDEVDANGLPISDSDFYVILPPSLHSYYSKIQAKEGKYYLETELQSYLQIKANKYSLRIYKVFKRKCLQLIKGYVYEQEFVIVINELKAKLGLKKSYSPSQVFNRLIMQTVENMNSHSELYIKKIIPLNEKADGSIPEYKFIVIKNVDFKPLKPIKNITITKDLPKDWTVAQSKTYIALIDKWDLNPAFCLEWVNKIDVTKIDKFLVKTESTLAAQQEDDPARPIGNAQEWIAGSLNKMVEIEELMSSFTD